MSKLTIRPLNPAVGAEVEGLEPSIPLDADTLRQLRTAFDEHSVLVFRNLDIDETFQRDLVYRLIGLDPSTAEPARTMKVSNKEENGAAPYGRLLFHCDNMWARTPQDIISLYGLKVEPPGAPTLFIGMGHAWDRLPEALRAKLEGLQARHGFDEAYPNRGGDADVIDARMAEPRSTARPVGFVHPRTGRKLLYVSQQATIEILGLSEAVNEALLEELFTYLYDPRFVLAHEWRQGDLVVWDNVATQHGRGSVSLQGPVRTLRKVTGPMNIAPDEQFAPVYSKVAEGRR
jgi:alpha-ketoglutarate-dependent taurine dioxygenase